jgi:hypothetical protein
MVNFGTTDYTEETDNTIASPPGPTVPEDNCCEKRKLNAENITATGGSAVVMPLGVELWLLMQSIFSMHNS